MHTNTHNPQRDDFHWLSVSLAIAWINLEQAVNFADLICTLRMRTSVPQGIQYFWWPTWRPEWLPTRKIQSRSWYWYQLSWHQNIGCTDKLPFCMILRHAEDWYFLEALWPTGHGLIDPQCRWARWTICIQLSNLLRVKTPANDRRKFSNDARRPPLGANNSQPSSACQRACRPLVIMYSMQGWRTNPLENVDKGTMAKKRHMPIVTEPHPKTTLIWIDEKARFMTFSPTCPKPVLRVLAPG